MLDRLPCVMACCAVMLHVVTGKGEERHVGEGPFSGWKTSHLGEGGLFGLEPTVTRTAMAGSGTQTDVGIVMTLDAWIYGQSWYPSDNKSFRFSMAASLGIGTTGFEGALSTEGAFGYRLSLSSGQEDRYGLHEKPLFRQLDAETQDSLDRVFAASPYALFARAGYSASMVGHQTFYSAMLEVPRLEFGLQHDGDLAMEARLEGGYGVTGRFNVDEAIRSLDGSLVWGGRLVLHAIDEWHAEVGLKRLDNLFEARFLPVVVVESASCVAHGSDEAGTWMRALCVNLRMEHGEVLRSTGVGDATVVYLGVLVSRTWMD